MRVMWRHKKRGGTYEAVAQATVQASTAALNDNDTVQVYVGEDGRWFVRKVEEFQDGRFERLPDVPGNRVLEELTRLRDLINRPENDVWLRGVHIEAVHQVERWGEATDRAKRPADWFWLVGYLAGKALHAHEQAQHWHEKAATAGDCETRDRHLDKAKHHTISTAAALFNWWCAMTGADVRMCPGSSDVAKIVEDSFPGTTGG